MFELNFAQMCTDFEISFIFFIPTNIGVIVEIIVANRAPNAPKPRSVPLTLVGNSSMLYVIVPEKHRDIIILLKKKSVSFAHVYAVN